MLCAVLFCVACSDDDDSWSAGPAVKDGAAQVHFAQGNDLSQVLIPDGTAQTISLTIERQQVGGELTVPVTVKAADDGLQIAPEAHFAAGDTTATIQITTPATAQQGDAYHYAIALGGDDVDPYADTELGTELTGAIFFPQERAAMMWLDGLENVAGYWGINVYDLGDQGLLIKDFMSSGTDLMISRNETANGIELSFTSPQWESRNIDPDQYYAGCTYYYFYNWAERTYDQFYPRGYDSPLYFDCLYLYSGDGYSNYDPETGIYTMMAYTLGISTVGTKEWVYMKLRFLADGETFDDTLPEAVEPDPVEPGDGEAVTFEASFNDLNNYFGGSWDMEATKTAEGTYLFRNFLLTGQDITITCDASTGGVSLSGGYSYTYTDGYWYLVDADNNYQTIYPNWQEGVQENIATGFYVYTADPSYSYWSETDQAIYLGSYVCTSDWVWDYLTLKIKN